jgi:hypothetical protein
MAITKRTPKNISLAVNPQNVTTVLVQDNLDDLWISTVTATTSGILDTKWQRLPPIVIDDTQAQYPVPTDTSNQMLPNTVNIKYTNN